MTEQEQEQEPSKASGNKTVIIIAGVVLVLLLIVGGIVAMLLSGDEPMAPTPTAQEALANAPALLGNSGNNEVMPDIRVNKTYLKIGPLYEMPLLVVNLISRKGKRYLRIMINFEMDNEALTSELEMKKVIVSDIILGILTSKTVEDLSSIKGKSRTKQEIIVTLNKSLLDGRIKNVFFTQFIIQ